LPDEQAKPVPQRLLSQQGWPEPPHATHVFAAVHTSPAPQRSPTARHVFELATVVSQQPSLQESPAQQG
jgi:hypothetical protein